MAFEKNNGADNNAARRAELHDLRISLAAEIQEAFEVYDVPPKAAQEIVSNIETLLKTIAEYDKLKAEDGE